jgi:hypothetical protein
VFKWRFSEAVQTATVEEMTRPAAGGHGGVLTQSQDYKFGLGIICVGRDSRLVHVLRRDELTGAVRACICHAAKNIVGTVSE